jgi:tripartite-type tricarboxylate transporter receptor subunit TctC
MLDWLSFIRTVGVTALFAVASFSAHAEPYPAKQVTIFVPYAAGAWFR